MTKRLTIDHNLRIEDQPDALISDFANKYIGGGCISSGECQEEILFLIFPQLFASMLICERMDYNEVIFISNIKRYANYTGYHKSLAFDDKIPPTEPENEIRRDIVAMDAIHFRNGSQSDQYRIPHILRELNKAFIAFEQIETIKD